MPNFPIIDSHVHLWDPEWQRVPWMDNLPALQWTADMAAFDETTAGIEVEGLVYLEIDIAPVYALPEAKAIQQLADEDSRVMGMVAFAPLEYGKRLRWYLEELIAVGPVVKGIRRLTQGEPDLDFCLQPGFVEGAKMLAEFNLSCDLCCLHYQLEPTIELVRRCPETQFVLDHIGNPNIRGEEREPWMSQMRELAALPNASCKVSGATTNAHWDSWTIDDLAPYLNHVLDVFGEDRVIFGSDWPVSSQATTYRRWVETIDTLTADWSESAKRKLWSENARRFYRL